MFHGVACQGLPAWALQAQLSKDAGNLNFLNHRMAIAPLLVYSDGRVLYPDGGEMMRVPYLGTRCWCAFLYPTKF